MGGVTPRGGGLEGWEGGLRAYYWDQGSALYQLGLLPESLPVVEAEAAQRLRDPRSVPANRLMPAGREGREEIKFHLPHLQARGRFHQSVLANLLAGAQLSALLQQHWRQPGRRGRYLVNNISRLDAQNNLICRAL